MNIREVEILMKMCEGKMFNFLMPRILKHFEHENSIKTFFIAINYYPIEALITGSLLGLLH